MTISSAFGNLGSNKGNLIKTPNSPKSCLYFSKSQIDRYLIRSNQFPDCGKEIVL